eukprot:1157729-Pelagomonas_calceolata.AAC.1
MEGRRPPLQVMRQSSMDFWISDQRPPDNGCGFLTSNFCACLLFLPVNARRSDIRSLESRSAQGSSSAGGASESSRGDGASSSQGEGSRRVQASPAMASSSLCGAYSAFSVF